MYPRFCAAADTIQAALLAAGGLPLVAPFKADAQRDQAETGRSWWLTVTNKMAEAGLIHRSVKLASMPSADLKNCNREVRCPAK